MFHRHIVYIVNRHTHTKNVLLEHTQMTLSLIKGRYQQIVHTNQKFEIDREVS